MPALARKLPGPAGAVTQFRPDFVQRSAVYLRDADRRRAGLAMTVTLQAAGLSGKQAAAALDVNRSTVSRYTDGEHDTPVSRCRELLRKLTATGAFPAPIIADLLADAWGCHVAGRTLEEIQQLRREVHKREQARQGEVDVWQMDDLAGVPADEDDAVDEAILGQIAALVELFALRAEEREILRNQRGG